MRVAVECVRVSLGFIAGVLTGLIVLGFVSGCGRTIKATVRGVYDVSQATALDLGEAFYRTGQQMGSGTGVSGGGLEESGRTLGEESCGVMSGAEDGSGERVVVSMDEVKEIAKRYGYEIE